MANKPTFSPSQNEAIGCRGENLLVAAGAGSGKTTVLVERILRQIEEGGSIDQILALTFTNAAAADMKEKLDRSISDLVLAEPQNSHLQEQQSLLPQAKISTIHSFCLDLLKQNYYQAGLDANFKVASETQIVLLEQETIIDLLEEAYADPDSGIYALADAYGGNKDDSGLIEIILGLYKFCRSRPQPLTWLAEASAVFNGTDLEQYPFVQDTIIRLQGRSDQAAYHLAKALDLSCGISDKWQGKIADELEQIKRIGQDDTQKLTDLLKPISQISFARLNPVADADADLKEQTKNERDKAKEIVKKMQERYTPISASSQAEELHSLAPLLSLLYQLIAAFDQRFTEEKRRRGWIDFGDMEHFALDLLAEDDFAKELAASYQEILIDEYQDINEVQEHVLQRLAKADNLFAVGDVKQSIYRFRLAEPQLFLQKYNQYGKSIGGRRIDLNNNYRSEIEIIKGINYIFDQLMRYDVAEIDYDDAARLYSKKTKDSPAPEFCLIDMDNSCNLDQAKGDQEMSTLQSTPIEAEARFICQRIRQLCLAGYNYSDMVVLLRAPKSKEAHLITQFAAWGIPAIFNGDQGFWETAEINLILDALAIIDNPHQDIPLAAVMRSPLADFSPEELIRIRYNEKKGDFYTALASMATKQEDQLGEKCAGFLGKLEQWRQDAGEQKVSSLISAIYRENGYYHFVGAMSDGALRQANLRLLLQEAYDYEQQEYAGLFRFLNLVQNRKEQKISPVASALPVDKEDAVRIMSIHKSKGLEFPIVFVMGLGGQFNFLDERRDIVWERDGGLGPMLVDRPKRLKHPTIAHSAVADRLREMALAEEIRIYYVALTRAKERLILSAAGRDLARQMTSWADAGTTKRLSAHYLLSAKSPLAWFAAALLRHPNAASWRALAGLEDDNILVGEGSWQIDLINEVALAAPEQIDDPATRPMPKPIEIPQEIHRALAYRYPFSEAATYPAKWSVSSLRRLAADQAFVTSTDYALESNGQDEDQPKSDPAMRGNAYHAFLEKLDFNAANNQKAIREQLVDLEQKGRISNEYQSIIDPRLIEGFLSGDLGQRLTMAQKVIREWEFTILAETSFQEQIVVQGILDVAFWENDGWIIMDYKTGGQEKSNDDLRHTYGEQLAYYKDALERLLQAPVKETWLVMLDLGRSILVEGQ